MKDGRFKWTKERELVLKEVTHSDQGLYAIRLNDMTYEIVRLTVSGTTDSSLLLKNPKYKEKSSLIVFHF